MTEFDDMMNRPLPRSAPEGKTLILVHPDGRISPVPAIWMATEADEFHGLRAAEAETGGTLVYVPEMKVEGVPHHELPRYDTATGTFLPPDPSTVRAEWVRQARAALTGTDWVLAKVTEEGLALTQAWRNWRQSLRNIINGADGPVTDEPQRWGTAGQHIGPVSIPEFLSEPPADVSEVLAEAGVSHLDTYERVNETLLPLFAQAKGYAEISRQPDCKGVFNGKTTIEWERKAQSINESIRWNAGRRIETI